MEKPKKEKRKPSMREKKGQQVELVDSVWRVCVSVCLCDFIECIIRRFTKFTLSFSLSLLAGTETWFLRRLQGRSLAQSAL